MWLKQRCHMFNERHVTAVNGVEAATKNNDTVTRFYTHSLCAKKSRARLASALSGSGCQS